MSSVFLRSIVYVFKVFPLLILSFVLWNQWMEGMTPFKIGGVANWAHIGGALGGFWYLYLTKGR